MENIIRKGISKNFYFYFFSWGYYYFSASYFYCKKIFIPIFDEFNEYKYISKSTPFCT